VTVDFEINVKMVLKTLKNVSCFKDHVINQFGVSDRVSMQLLNDAAARSIQCHEKLVNQSNKKH